MENIIKKYITFDNIIDNYINADSIEQNVLYIGVGTAANMILKKKNKLDSCDEQQYIPFLKHIKNMFPDIHLHIILIDKALQNPPYCVQVDNLSDTPNNDQYSISDNKWKKDIEYDNIYNSTYGDKVYVIMDYMYYDNSETIEKLYELNEHIKNNNDILLFHDFTGRDTYTLSYLFDEQIEGYKDRIIYDITLRFDGTCYVDMTDKTYFLDIEMYGKYIHLLNPYNIKSENIANAINTAHTYNYKMQLLISINNRMHILKNIIYPFYRKYNILKNKIKNKNISNKEIINLIDNSKYDNIFSIGACSGYSDLYCDINDYSNNPLDINKLENMLDKYKYYLKIFLKGLLFISFSHNLDNIEYMTDNLIKLIDSEPYKWSDIIEYDYIKSPLKNIGIDLSLAPTRSCYL